MTAITRELAEFVARTSYDTLPAEVRERVKTLTLDLVGIALRARNEAESTPAMVAATCTRSLASLSWPLCTDLGNQR